MNFRAGNPIDKIDPSRPREALEADTADPGEVSELRAEQIERKEGKYGSEKTEPFKPDEEGVHWIEVELIGEDDEPIPGEEFQVTMPDGRVARGSLDQHGVGRIDGIKEPGQCKITFPRLDKDAWEPA